MNSNRKTAIIVGVLFLTAILTSMLGDGLIKSIVDDPDYLINVYPNKTRVITGILLQLICAIAVVGIAVMLFPILKKHNEPIALSYVGFRVIESAIIFVSAISILLLITLSQEYVKARAPDASSFQTVGTLAVAGHNWAFQMAIIVCGIAGLMFCYLLYQSKLIPRFMSVLGIIGYPLSLVAPLLDMFDIIDTLHGAGLIMYLPGAIFEVLLLPIWLFVKGFNSLAVDSDPAKTVETR
jgi:amino acid permease